MLLDKFDSLYSSLTGKSRIQSAFRFFIRELNDILIPIYFKLFPVYISQLPVSSEKRVIVSLTTFPQRIGRLWIVIECLLRQSVLPNEIILYLAKSQFPQEWDNIPKRLLKYRDLGLLTISFKEEDIRSHKKYYYALQDFRNDIIITVDDDIYYASNIISDLMTLHDQHPDTICCLRGYKVLKKEGNILPYRQWEVLYQKRGPLFDIFHTSGGGTLYKKSFFSEEVFNKDLFMRHCRYADDIWLNIMAQLNHTKTVRGRYYSNLLPIKTRSIALSKENVKFGGNDKQLKALINIYNLKEDEIFN